MRKTFFVILLVLSILMTTVVTCAETLDLESLNLEQLIELNQRTEELLKDTILEKTRNDRQAMTTENGLLMADNGEEAICAARKCAFHPFS